MQGTLLPQAGLSQLTGHTVPSCVAMLFFGCEACKEVCLHRALSMQAGAGLTCKVLLLVARLSVVSEGAGACGVWCGQGDAPHESSNNGQMPVMLRAVGFAGSADSHACHSLCVHQMPG